MFINYDWKHNCTDGSGLASSSIFSDNATEMIDRIKREIYLHGSVVTTMKAYYVIAFALTIRI